MATRYVTEQVNLALVEARGDAGEAVRLLARTCAQDETLLRELVSPYLPSILRRTIATATGGAPAGRPAASQLGRRSLGGARTSGLTDRSLDAVLGQLSQSIGTGKPAPTSRAAHLLAPERRPEASQRHRDALHTMAVAFARKRLES